MIAPTESVPGCGGAPATPKPRAGTEAHAAIPPAKGAAKLRPFKKAAALAAVPLVRAARAESAAQADVEVKNPFELKSAAAFAAAFALVILASRFLRDRFGDVALYLAAVVAGLTDVDAITVSTASLAREGLGLDVASGVIIAACLSNTAVKAGIAFVVGGRAVGMQVARVFGAMIMGGVVAIGVALVP